MNTPRTILVAVDFSTGSHAALVQAARLATLSGARLHVLHVVDSEAVATLASLREESFESHARTAVEGARKALASWLHGVTLPAGFETTIATGVPLHEILGHIRSLHADMLVAGIMGKGGASAGAGSVSAKLARKAQIPTLLVRSGHPEAFRKIVACVDFSDTAREVVRMAQSMATQDGAHVDFLHVWREPWVVTPRGGMFTEDTAPPLVFTDVERKALIQNLHQTLHEFVQKDAAATFHSEVLRESMSYAPGIQEHAAECGADLIVIGSKGRSNLRYVLLGSTAERLLARLTCSVLVVPAEATPAESPS
ncbi:universal stress protein [Prosthecobacter sp.]|uniref:universal stress protein n=1 Tax=Prosthecobacter sp. TaxID=1965333 RepID=UPI0037841AA4